MFGYAEHQIIMGLSSMVTITEDDDLVHLLSINKVIIINGFDAISFYRSTHWPKSPSESEYGFSFHFLLSYGDCPINHQKYLGFMYDLCKKLKIYHNQVLFVDLYMIFSSFKNIMQFNCNLFYNNLKFDIFENIFKQIWYLKSGIQKKGLSVYWTVVKLLIPDFKSTKSF